MSEFIYSKETDTKWQKIWHDTGIYKFDKSRVDRKFYLLEMFSYPSGANLHIGHWWNFGLSDSYGRFKRMQGYELFHPFGFDAFGLPAENYAIKTGTHPKDSTEQNIATMEEQFRAMGTTYDWDYEITTCHEDYYKWTQWLFLQLYKRGLAYRKEALVNWCPSCQTTLSNEQAAGGKCERCESEVLRKNMTQWFFKITDYAEELLAGLDALDWPEKTKQIQRNWIGKSEGAEIIFTADGHTISVFTTRADTLMGVTYLVLAPEHPLVDELTRDECRPAVQEYVAFAARQSEIERTSTVKDKTGVFTGAYAEHPLTGERIPIWIADYVLQSYGTGAVMAVPAHDERDYAFAVKFKLPIREVVAHGGVPLPFCDDGVLINSGGYDGLTSEMAREKITADLERVGKGASVVKYRMRDWSVSRQRYWGCPIPVVYCADCGIVPVDECDLPVTLPYDVAFMPSGQSPLRTCNAFVNTTCPICEKPAKRETDTLDTFVCSSWYYLRFYDNKNDRAPFDKKRVSQIMPVDKYVGGIEHASMHLLYARFITKALRDMGFLTFDEPFPSLFHQGIILGKDGKRMSKRNGALPPDVLIDQYGADVFRMYLGFGFSYQDGGMWNDAGIKSIARFTSRIGKAAERFMNYRKSVVDNEYLPDVEADFTRHSAIKQVTNDLEKLSFNTAIARIMEFLNTIQKYQTGKVRNASFEESLIKDLILLLAPLAPHFCEELWAFIGCPYSVHNQPFPVCDDTKLRTDLIQIAVQVNGTLRDVIAASGDADEETVKKLAMSSEKIQSAVGSGTVQKTIYVKGRIFNIVIS